MISKLNTLGLLFLNRCELSKDNLSIGWIEDDHLNFYNYKDYKTIIESLSIGLVSLGLKIGDKLSIMANTCKEWHLLDISTMCSRAVVVPIYHTYTAKDVAYIINHSESKFLCIENKDQLLKIKDIKNQLTSLKFIISFSDIKEEVREELSPIEVITFKELLLTGGELLKSETSNFEINIKSQDPKEIASIIYTSGTTGEPKGAVISHEAIAQMLRNVKDFINGAFQDQDRSLVFLPLSHVIGRIDSLIHLIFGSEIVFAESMENLLSNIKIAKPTYMLAVPRVFEKFYEKIMNAIEEGSLVKKSLFKWAEFSARRYYEKIDKDLSPSTYEIVQYELAYELFYKRFAEIFGGRIRFFVSGGAPLSVDIIKFLRNANLPVLEGYGLTETIGPSVVNPISRQIPGTVGKPIGDVKINFSDENEILISSKAMLTEYYKSPEETNKHFKDGWFYTGDIGEFDENGYLKITDRKKDIIITSGGKNIAPQKIENLLKSKNHITHCAVIGNKRKYLTALIGIEKDNFINSFNDLGIDIDISMEQLAHNPNIRAIIRKEIEEINEDLASFETIKKFYILPFEINANNYLTPSLKIKKKKLIQDFYKEINAMYQ